MAIISNFPTERDWNAVIEALAVEIMSGGVQLSIETRDGTSLTTRTGAGLGAYKAYSYSEISGKPKINGYVLEPNSTGEQLGLASVGTVNALLSRIIALEGAVNRLNQTNFMIANSQSE